MKNKLKNQTKLHNRKILSLVLAFAVCLSIATYQLLPESNAEGTALAASASTSASASSSTSFGLKAPSIKVAASGYEGLKITWAKVSGAGSYEIYRASSKSGTYKKLAAVRNTTYADKNAAQNRTYYYKVRAVSGKSKSSFSSIQSGKIRTAVSLKKVPAYSGNPYTEVSGGKTYFAKNMYVKKSSQTFSKLDSLGRCGAAIAVVGRDLMPTEERGSIGMIKPAGWHTVRYDDLIADKYLYNRCHLIGYQLTGENANEQNLITGTRYLNVEGMLPFENQVADYVRKTGNHVLYRVTPIYDGNDLVARGVEMEASSAEDQGKGLEFHVFVYNVQPGIEIDYATGGQQAGVRGVRVDRNSRIVRVVRIGRLHEQFRKFRGTKIYSQHQYKEIPPSHLQKRQSDGGKKQKAVTASRDEIIADGYSPCGNCKP